MTDTNKASAHMKAKLQVGRVNVAEYSRALHHADIPAGTPVEAVFSPLFWAHHASQFHAKDKIECFWDDGSQEITLRVLYASTVEAIVSPIGDLVVHDKKEVGANDTYEVIWAGPHAKHRVQTKDGKKVIRDGFATKEQAEDFRREHQKVVPA